MQRGNTKKNDIYIESLLSKRLSLPITSIGSDIQHVISKQIVLLTEGRCTSNGYVKPKSVKIITFSSGVVNSSNVIFDIVYQCLICCPVEGMIVECVAKDINKAGIRAEMKESPTPMVIFIARDHNYNSSIFSDVKSGDIIHARIIGQRFEMNDAYVSVIAEIITFDPVYSGSLNIPAVSMPQKIVGEETMVITEPLNSIALPTEQKNTQDQDLEDTGSDEMDGPYFTVFSNSSYTIINIVQPLLKMGFTQIPIHVEVTYNFIYGETTENMGRYEYDGDFMTNYSDLKSVLDDKKTSITDISKMYWTMNGNSQQYAFLPETRLLNDIIPIKPGELYTVTDALTKNSQMVFSEADLSVYKQRNVGAIAIVQKYPTSPLLCDKRIFNACAYVLVYSRGGINTFYDYPIVDILLTETPYSKNSNNNQVEMGKMYFPTKNTTNKTVEWPPNVNSKEPSGTYIWSGLTEPILKNIKTSSNGLISSVCKSLNDNIAPGINCYAGFEIFAINMMFDTTGNAMLMSVNDKFNFDRTLACKLDPKHAFKLDKTSSLVDNSSLHETYDEKLDAGIIKKTNCSTNTMNNWILDTAVSNHFGIAVSEKSYIPFMVEPATVPGALTLYTNTLKEFRVKIIPFEDTISYTAEFSKQLSVIGSILEIYNSLGDGNTPWGQKKIEDLRKDAVKDARKILRSYYHWAIISHGKAIGYIGLRPDKKNSALQLRYFLSPDIMYRRKKITSCAVSLVLEAQASLHTPNNPIIFAKVHTENKASGGLLGKMGFERNPVREFLGGHEVDVYSRVARLKY